MLGGEGGQIVTQTGQCEQHPKHSLAAALQADNAGFETPHAYFLDRLLPVCGRAEVVPSFTDVNGGH